MGEYDRAMKLLVTGDPKALVEFVLQRARSKYGSAMRVKYIEVPAELSTEFPGIDAEADGLLLITTEDGRRFLVHIEFQSKNDPLMADRLLDYCLRARHKHSPKEGPPLPIISCVIYLRECGQVPEPPLTWTLFDDEKNLIFDYISIKLNELPREEILALNEPGLLPLSLLAKGTINGTIVKEMFEKLLAHKLYDLLPIGHTIATWVLGAADLVWLEREESLFRKGKRLNRRFFCLFGKEDNKMLDIFKDSPTYKWMERDARAEAQQALREEMQHVLSQSRQNVVVLVTKRFPKLAKIAAKQVQKTENLNALQQALISIATTNDAIEVANILANIDEEDDESGEKNLLSR